MTNPTVTQADRDAAAAISNFGRRIKELILSGEYDDHPFVQAYAAHREAAYAQAIDDAVAVAKRNHDYDTQDQIAALKENRRG